MRTTAYLGPVLKTIITGFLVGALALCVLAGPPVGILEGITPVKPPPVKPPRSTCTFVVSPRTGAHVKRLSGNKWVEMRIDSPIRLEHGRYAFKAEAPGFYSQTQYHNVSRNNISVRFTLKRLIPPIDDRESIESMVKVTIGRVNPEGATIEVMGYSTSVSPESTIFVPAGSVEVTIKMDGYMDYADTRTLGDGGSWTVPDVTLTPKKYRFTAEVDAPSATVEIWDASGTNKIATHKSTKPFELENGVYQVTATADGYNQAPYKEITIDGTDATESLHLEKTPRIPQGWIVVDASNLDSLKYTVVVDAGDPVDNPSKLSSVRPGSHTVIVSAKEEGYDPCVYKFDVSDGRTYQLKPVFTKTRKYGTLSVTLTPDDAKFWVDGNPTDQKQLSLSVGDHTVRAAKDGFISDEQAITVSEDGTPLEITLVKEYYLQAQELNDEANRHLDDAAAIPIDKMSSVQKKSKMDALNAAIKCGEGVVQLVEDHASSDAGREDVWRDAEWAAHDTLGAAYLEQARMLKNDDLRDASEAELRSAIQADAEQAYTHFGLAMLLANRAFAKKTFDVEEALREFERAIRLKPGYGKFYGQYSIALAMAGRKDDAVQAAENAKRYYAADGDYPTEQQIDMIIKQRTRG